MLESICLTDKIFAVVWRQLNYVMVRRCAGRAVRLDALIRSNLLGGEARPAMQLCHWLLASENSK